LLLLVLLLLLLLLLLQLFLLLSSSIIRQYRFVTPVDTRYSLSTVGSRCYVVAKTIFVLPRVRPFVRSSVRTYHRGSHGADLSKVTYWGILCITVEKIQIGLKSRNNMCSWHEARRYSVATRASSTKMDKPGSRSVHLSVWMSAFSGADASEKFDIWD
jgi:hypothetical protein